MALWTYRKTVVFWDFDDCPIPDRLDAVVVSQNIKKALWNQGYKGIVHITAFGDIFGTKDDFYYSGIGIRHCPKDASDVRRMKILANFLCKAIGKMYELNLMLIVGDISKHLGFVSALRYLKSKLYYSVLLAQPVSSDNLLRTTSLLWLWSSLARGEDPIINTLVDEDNYSDCEQLYVASKTAVFWDMDGCQIPQGVKTDVISKNIRSALANEGFGDPVTIYAYGDMNQLHGLESIGIKPRYFPAGSDQKDKLEKILVDAFCCAVDRPGTTNLMLIMGDVSGHDEFIFAANILNLRNYNVLVAQPDDLQEQLHSEAKKKWLWSSLVAGRGPLPLTPSLQAFMNYLTVTNHRLGLINSTMVGNVSDFQTPETTSSDVVSNPIKKKEIHLVQQQWSPKNVQDKNKSNESPPSDQNINPQPFDDQRSSLQTDKDRKAEFVTKKQTRMIGAVSTENRFDALLTLSDNE